MRRQKREKHFGLTVVVEDGKFEKALRTFKKKVEESGLLKEVKDRQQYVKPSIKRKLAKSAAKKRWQKKLSQDSLPKKEY
jgi:small subunit ribosomal protein S21